MLHSITSAKRLSLGLKYLEVLLTKTVWEREVVDYSSYILTKLSRSSTHNIDSDQLLVIHLCWQLASILHNYLIKYSRYWLG